VRRVERAASHGKLIRRVENSYSVHSLARAVSKAAVRVNPTNPDAFLSLLSTRMGWGRAEYFDDPNDESEQSAFDEAAVQTDQPLPVHDDLWLPARLKQLQQELTDMEDQLKITQIVTYVAVVVAFILVLLFASRLWAAMMHPDNDVAKQPPKA